MNEWKDRKPHPATEEMIKAEWGLRRKRLRCALCGHVFKVGDIYRWCYMNSASPSPGNFFVCASCDFDGLEEMVREGMRRHKPHMEQWVLLYMLERARQRGDIDGGAA